MVNRAVCGCLAAIQCCVNASEEANLSSRSEILGEDFVPRSIFSTHKSHLHRIRGIHALWRTSCRCSAENRAPFACERPGLRHLGRLTMSSGTDAVIPSPCTSMCSIENGENRTPGSWLANSVSPRFGCLQEAASFHPLMTQGVAFLQRQAPRHRAKEGHRARLMRLGSISSSDGAFERLSMWFHEEAGSNRCLSWRNGRYALSLRAQVTCRPTDGEMKRIQFMTGYPETCADDQMIPNWSFTTRASVEA